jgi:hypothetical protein
MREGLMQKSARVLGLATLFLLPWQTRYIFWRPWVGTTESEFGTMSLYATMILGVIAAALFALDDYRKKGGACLLWKMSIAGVLIFIAAGVLWLQTYPSATHAWALNAVCAACLGFLAYNLAKHNKKRALQVIFLGLVPPLLLGVWQMCAGFSPGSSILGLAARNAAQLGDAVLVVGKTRILRMYGTFPHPNIFGTALALSSAATIAMTTISKKKTHILILAVACMGIALCISRSAALAIVCALLVWFTRETHYKKTTLVLIAAIAPFVWIMQFVAPNLLAIRGASAVELHSVSERVEQMAVWKDVMNHGGILGTGIYKYPEALAERAETFQAAWAYQPVHNVFLLLLAELGVWWFAFIVFVAMRGTWLFKEQTWHMVPFLVALWSLAWFDHALWTSWTGMAYTAICLGFLMSAKNEVSTLS